MGVPQSKSRGVGARFWDPMWVCGDVPSPTSTVIQPGEEDPPYLLDDSHSMTKT